MHFGHIFVPADRGGSGIWRFSPRRPLSAIGQVRPSRPSLRLFFRILFGYSRMRRPTREVLNAGVVHAACGFVVYAGYYPACRSLFCLLRLLYCSPSISSALHAAHLSLAISSLLCARGVRPAIDYVPDKERQLRLPSSCPHYVISS